MIVGGVARSLQKVGDAIYDVARSLKKEGTQWIRSRFCVDNLCVYGRVHEVSYYAKDNFSFDITYYVFTKSFCVKNRFLVKNTKQ